MALFHLELCDTSESKVRFPSHFFPLMKRVEKWVDWAQKWHHPKWAFGPEGRDIFFGESFKEKEK